MIKHIYGQNPVGTIKWEDTEWCQYMWKLHTANDMPEIDTDEEHAIYTERQVLEILSRAEKEGFSFSKEFQEEVENE